MSTALVRMRALALVLWGTLGGCGRVDQFKMSCVTESGDPVRNVQLDYQEVFRASGAESVRDERIEYVESGGPGEFQFALPDPASQDSTKFLRCTSKEYGVVYVGLDVNVENIRVVFMDPGWINYNVSPGKDESVRLHVLERAGRMVSTQVATAIPVVIGPLQPGSYRLIAELTSRGSQQIEGNAVGPAQVRGQKTYEVVVGRGQTEEIR